MSMDSQTSLSDSNDASSVEMNSRGKTLLFFVLEGVEKGQYNIRVDYNEPVYRAEQSRRGPEAIQKIFQQGLDLALSLSTQKGTECPDLKITPALANLHHAQIEAATGYGRIPVDTEAEERAGHVVYTRQVLSGLCF